MPNPQAEGGGSADRELLALASEVFSREGFLTEEAHSDGWPIVLAENQYFVVAVAAASTIGHLLAAESQIVSTLNQRMNEAQLGPKSWDGYVVLLTQELVLESRDLTSDLFAFNYDTSSVRRLAHAGVQATMRDVRRALAPFVRPIELDDASIVQDPFGPFVVALTRAGVEPEFARRTVFVFERGGRIEDAI